MAREIIWTDPAWDDVENAADYIAQDSKFYAAAFVPEIKEAAASLATFAERGQVVPEFGDESCPRIAREILSSCLQGVRETGTHSHARAWSAAPSEVLSGAGPEQPGPDNTRLERTAQNAAAQPQAVMPMEPLAMKR